MSFGSKSLLVCSCIWVVAAITQLGAALGQDAPRSAPDAVKRLAVGDVLADVPMREVLLSAEDSTKGRRPSDRAVRLSQLESKLVLIVMARSQGRGYAMDVLRVKQYVHDELPRQQVVVLVIDSSTAEMPDKVRKRVLARHPVAGYLGLTVWAEPTGALQRQWGLSGDRRTVLIDKDRRVLALDLFEHFAWSDHDRNQIQRALQGKPVIPNPMIELEDHPLVDAVLRARAERMSSGRPSDLPTADLVRVLHASRHPQAGPVLLRLDRGDRESREILEALLAVFVDQPDVAQEARRRLADYHPVQAFSGTSYRDLSEGSLHTKLINEDIEPLHVWLRVKQRRRFTPMVELQREYGTRLEPGQEWTLVERLVNQPLSCYGDFDVSLDLVAAVQPDKYRTPPQPPYRYHLEFHQLVGAGRSGRWPNWGDDEVGRLAEAVKWAERVAVPSYGFSEVPIAARREVLNKPAPPLQIARWIGEPVDLTAYRGKVVLLDFWGTWCNACMSAFPRIIALHEKHRQQGLVVIAVHSAHWDRAVEGYLAENPLPYAVAVDNGHTAGSYAVEQWPAYIVIDRAGIVRGHHYKVAETEAAVRAALRRPAERP